MRVTAVSDVAEREPADLLIFPFVRDESGPVPCASLPGLREEVETIIEGRDFSGKAGSTLLFYPKGGREKRVLCLGLGEEKEATGDKGRMSEIIRRAFADAVRRCRGENRESIHILLPTVTLLDSNGTARAVLEGIALSTYLFEEWKSEKKPFAIHALTLIGHLSSGCEGLADEVFGITEGVNLARTLVHGNALDVTPQRLAEEAKHLAKKHPTVKTSVLDKGRIIKEGMGLFSAVASGSRVDPELIIVEYRGNPGSSEVTMVVGKGATLDTGGLNLKPGGHIEGQKADMSGGAAALGIIEGAANIKLGSNVIAIVPATENAIDAHSYKPGDVYRAYSGTTVEITNTDAEGRLILADAIAYGEKTFSPARIIDLATLTGAIVVALGSVRAGLFSNDDRLATLCEEAGEETGERVWRMPLDKEYEQLLKSEIADTANSSNKRWAGSVTAALFLRKFVSEKTPWIHLDIAGTAFLDDGPEGYHLTKATGAGVRLVLRLLEKLS
ncbi:MAG: leucyl aminopeptidase [Simkaniaceae bacterium]|nr:leucyl aminopeptidase [Simkaniaceae bacterium]